MKEANGLAKKYTKSYDIIFLLVLFLIGFIATFSYGAYLDQDSEQEILFSNIKEYLQHLPVESQLQQEMDVDGIVAISESIEKDHGIAAYYPIFFLWYLNQNQPNYGSLVWHMYTYLFIFGVGCCSLYFLGKNIYKSKTIASFITLLFFFTPRMFAESHYNNKDMILLALLFACFYYGWRIIQKCSWIDVILFALCGAFAFNTKVIGACFFGIIGLYVLAYYIFTKQFNPQILLKMCVCILTWFAVYVLITPACWSDLIGFFKYILGYAVNFERWKGYILYNGELIHTDYTGIPHKYLPTMMLLTIPIGTLLVIVLGYFLLFFDLIKGGFRKIFATEGYVFMIALAGLIPLCYAILAQTPVYNGWRHFYFVYTTMIICSGYAVYRIKGLVKKTSVMRILKYGSVVYISILFLGILVNHPQEHSYFNLLAGEEVEESYELDYWNLSVYQAYEIIDEDSTENQVSVGALNTQTMWGLENNWDILPDRMKDRIYVSEQWENADYIIVNTTYANIYNAEEYNQIKEQYTLTAQIKSYGNIICEVYKNAAK